MRSHRFLLVLSFATLFLSLFVAIAAAEDSLEIVDGDEAGPPTAALIEGGDGAFLMSNAPVRDEFGTGIDPEPSLAVVETSMGDVLAPSEGAGDYGVVGTPAAGSTTAILGSSIFDAFRIELVGRRAVAPQHAEGTANYEGAAPGGSDVETTLRAGHLEEWIVVDSPEDIQTYRYRVTAPSEVQLVREPDGTITATSANGSMRISAPIALDADGRSFTPRIEPVDGGFELTVPGAEDATFPLRIDPLFATNDGTDIYTGTHCGPGSDDTNDRSLVTDPRLPDNDNATCTSPNLSGLLRASTPAGMFWSHANSQGIGVGFDPGTATGSKAGSVRFEAPDGAGIWSAQLRGHIGTTNGDIRCEFTYDSNISKLWIPAGLRDDWFKPGRYGIDDPEGGAYRRLFAGAPQGTGDAWATFPMPGGYQDFPGGGSQLNHMVGYFDLSGGDGNNVASIPTLALAKSIQIAAYAKRNVTANAGHRCMIDGIARIALVDRETPSFDLDGSERRGDTRFRQGDLGTLGRRVWHRPADVTAADGGLPLRSMLYRDGQSGVRQARTTIGAVLADGVDWFPNEFPNDLPAYRQKPCTPDSASMLDPDAPRLLLGESTWNNEGDATRPGPCPTSVTFAPGQLSIPVLHPRDSAPGRHGVQSVVEDFTHKISTINPTPLPSAAPTDGPSFNQTGWYWVDAEPPTCRSLGVTGTIRNAQISVQAFDPGYTMTNGNSTSLTNGTKPFRQGSGLQTVRVRVNDTSRSFTSFLGADLSPTFSVNLRSGERVENRRRIADIVVEVIDRAGADAGFVVNPGAGMPAGVPVQHVWNKYTVPYPTAINQAASATTKCAMRLDIGPYDQHAPTCTPTTLPGSISKPAYQAAAADDVHFIDPDDNGIGSIRVYAQDPEWMLDPAGASGIGRIRLTIGTAALPERTLTDVERDQGFVDFENINLNSYRAIHTGTSLDAYLSHTVAPLPVTAIVFDRSDAVDRGADKNVTCSRTFTWRVDPTPPTCTPSPIHNEEPRPISGSSSIHVIDPDNDGVADVVVDYDAAIAGGATVRLTVNGNVIATQAVAAAATTVTFHNVDLLAGIVPEEGTMTSFYSRQATIVMDALVTDRTVILPPETQAQHQVTCHREIPLRLDTTQPNCFDDPPNGPTSRPIHLRDADDGTDRDAYGTIRVYVDDAGSRNPNGTLVDPPQGAGVKVVRLSLNGEPVDPSDPLKTRILNDVERAQGYVDFPGLDFYENIVLDDEGNPAVTIDNDPNRYFQGPVTVRVRAELDDRTVLFAPEHLAEHTNECSIERVFGQPDETVALEAVRGADNIVGVWPALADNVRGYLWRCGRDNPVTPIIRPSRFEADDAERLETLGSGLENRGMEIPAGTYVNTPRCVPGTEYGTNRGIRLFARAEVDRVLSDERSAVETIDLAPQAGAAAPAEVVEGVTWSSYLWMSENGVTRDFGTRRDALPIRILDRDGSDDLFSPSDPDERILQTELTRADEPLTPAGDPARVVVGLRDRLGAESVLDQRAYVVIQLADDESDILYRLVDGEGESDAEDHAVRSLNADDADTCRAGDPREESAVGAYWVLRCDLIPAWGTALDAANTWHTLLLPVHPREYETGVVGLRDGGTYHADAFPLEGGEQHPAEAAHNTAKPTPDRFTYELNIAVRDRRQRSDDRYLVSSPHAAEPDRPMPNIWETVFSGGGISLVVDRVLPTVAADLLLTPNGLHVPVRANVADPRPSAASDPTSRNASGLRGVSIELFESDALHDHEPVDETRDVKLAGGALDPATCDGPFPLHPNTTGPDRDSQSTCGIDIPVKLRPGTDKPEVGTYKIRTIVTDMATNWRQDTQLLIVPAAATVTAVRGAGGVAAWWPDVRGAERFAYTCTVDGYTSPEQIVTDRDSSGFWASGLCPAEPGQRVDIEVTSINRVGIRGVDTDSDYEHVDQRPVIALQTSGQPSRLAQLSSAGWWESSFNGRSFRPEADVADMIDEKTPYTVVDITDPDHNLLQHIAPDEHMLDLDERPDCTPCANDHPRAVITLRPEMGTEPSEDHRDLVEAGHVLVQLDDDDQQYIRIWDGPRDATAWDRDLDANDPDTCRPGEPGRVIHSQPSGMWTLDCERSVFTLLHETLPDTSVVDTGVRVRLAVSPQDRGDSAAPRFPTPDQPYRVQAMVKDQRQAADHRFLTNAFLVNTDEDVPDASPIVADEDLAQPKWLWVDRVLPRVEDHQITRIGEDTGPHRHDIEIDPIDPSDSTTDPDRIAPSGLWRAHVRGGLVNTTGEIAHLVVDAYMSCLPAATLGYRPESTCGIDTGPLSVTGTYRYTVTLTDFVGNTSQTNIEKFYTAPPKPPVLSSESSARGQGVHWNPVIDASYYTWECRNLTNGDVLIDSGVASTPFTTGVYRTDFCAADSGDRVSFSVQAFGIGGRSHPAETWRWVDRRPSVIEGNDPDGRSAIGATIRHDRTNGEHYANGTTNRDLYVATLDADPELDRVVESSPHWDDLAERPLASSMAAAAANAPARTVIAIRPPAGRPSAPTAFLIVQHGDEHTRAVKLVNASFSEDLATTPILVTDYLSDETVCRPGQNKPLSTPYWTLDCGALTSSGDEHRVDTLLPIRPKSTTPDQTYSVTGWVRDGRQRIDFRYHAQGANGPGFDEPYAGASTTPLGTIVLDRILPIGTVDVPAISGGATTIRVTGAHDPTPSMLTTPTTFDPTGLARVTARITDPAGATLLAETQMTCDPALPRPMSDHADCDIAVTPVIAGTHTVTMRLTDVAGNVREYVVTFEFSTVAPPNAPATISITRGARGIGAFWSPVSGATGYTWECRKQSNGALVSSGAAVPSSTPPRWRTALCPGIPSEVLVMTVRSVGPGGSSPTATTAAFSVDDRPTISKHEEPDGSTTRYDTLNGQQYANGTTDRDVSFQVTDTFIEFPTGASIDFNGILERPDPIRTLDGAARSIVAIRPPAGRPIDTTAYVIVQYNGTQANNVRRVALMDSSFAGDLATFPIDSSVPFCDLSNEVAGKLHTAYWSLDCADIDYVVASTSDIRVSLPIRPKAVTPDQTYSVSGWVRDQRQHLDNRYLSSDESSSYDQPYQGAKTVDLGTLVVDRVTPMGAPNVPATSLGQVTLGIDAAQDVNPAQYDGTGLAAARVSVRRSDGTVVLASTGMTCAPALPQPAGTLTSCTHTFLPPTTGTYVATLRLVDVAGNWWQEERTFTHTAVPAPVLSLSYVSPMSGSTGTAVVITPVPNATSFTWTCSNASTGAFIASGTAVASANGFKRSGLCEGAYGQRNTFEVIAHGPGGNSAPFLRETQVNDRPTIENAADTDGASTRYDTANGMTYSNGTTDRDLRVRIVDAFESLSPGGHYNYFDDLPERASSRSSPARTIVAVRARDRAQVWPTRFIIEHSTAAAPVRVWMVSGAPSGDLATMAIPPVTGANKVCTEGQAKVLAADGWTLDCTRFFFDGGANYQEMQAVLPLRPTSSLADQAYSVTGWVRDHSQSVDWKYLSSDPSSAPDQPYSSAVGTPLGTIVVDRVQPDGGLTASQLPSGGISVQVAAARDVLPAQYDATGLALATVSIDGPAGSALLVDAPMSCSPGLPRASNDASTCAFNAQPATTGTHTVRVKLVDVAGNHRTLTSTIDVQPASSVPPIAAPEVSVRRATNGVVAKWAPLADATGYRWTCENLTRNTSEQGTQTQIVGTVVRAPVCTGNGSNPAGTNVRVTVTPFNASGDGPASVPVATTVDVRPTMTVNTASGFNPDAGFAWTYSKSGRVHSNGTRNREIFVRAVDADGDLLAAPAIDADLNPGVIVAAASRARFIARISPEAGNPLDPMAHVIVQLGPDDGSRLVKLVEGAPQAGIDAIELNPSDADTCAPGQTGKTLVGTYWQMNCERVFLTTPAATPTAVDMRLPLFPRVAVDGTHQLPDQTYSFSGYVRDVRQPADNSSLTHNASTSSTDYATVPQQLLAASLLADRLDPTGSVDAVRTGPDGARRIQVTGTLSSTVPGIGTNPSGRAATPMASARVTIDRITGPYAPERIANDVAAVCAPLAVTSTCAFTSSAVQPASTYRVTMTGVDQAGNVGAMAPVEVELPEETSTRAGFLDPRFGHAGFAHAEFGTGPAVLRDVASLPNGHTVSAGTYFAGSNMVALASHTGAGQLDSAFGMGGKASVAPVGWTVASVGAVTADSSGRVLVAGSGFDFRIPGNNERSFVARFLANGSIDTSFGISGFATLQPPKTPAGANYRLDSQSVAVDLQGRIVLSGYDGDNALAVVRFLPSGAPDLDWSDDAFARFVVPGRNVVPDSGTSAVMPDGRILLAGSATNSTEQVPVLARINADGLLDETFGTSGWFNASAIPGAVKFQGVIADDDGAATVGMVPFGVARIEADGTLDSSFGESDGWSVASVQPMIGAPQSFDVVSTDDGFVVTGVANNVSARYDHIAIARFNEDGTVDTEFGYDGSNIAKLPMGELTSRVRAAENGVGDIVVSTYALTGSNATKFTIAAFLS